MKYKRRIVYLSDELWAALKWQAEEEGTSISEQVRRRAEEAAADFADTHDLPRNALLQPTIDRAGRPIPRGPVTLTQEQRDALLEQNQPFD